MIEATGTNQSQPQAVVPRSDAVGHAGILFGSRGVRGPYVRELCVTSLAMLVWMVGNDGHLTPRAKARWAVMAADALPDSDSSANAPASASAEKLPKAWEPNAPMRPWQSIVVHHSATAAGNVAAIDAVHRQQKDQSGKPWLGIGYHFVVGNGQKMADGEIEPTFRWHQQLAGAHAGSREHNERGIGICLIGNFDESAPTARQITAVRDLTRRLCARFGMDRQQVVRHSTLKATLCPGRLFPWDEVVTGLPAARGS